MTVKFDYKRLAVDPAYKRIVRESLEDDEQTPRSLVLRKIQEVELAVTTLLEALAEYEPAAVLVEAAYDKLNDLYLLVSPQDEQQPTPEQTALGL